MSVLSFILFGSLLSIFCRTGETIHCPKDYNLIISGCYKIVNGTSVTWTQARNNCSNDYSQLSSHNDTVPNATTHLVALESLIEKNSLFYWMNAYNLQGSFWIDGVLSTSVWNWSNQSILWYFEADLRAIYGNGTNYKLIYNSNSSIKYQIADDIQQNPFNYICEYQIPCNDTSPCGYNGKCYMNFGEPLCICSPGFTGSDCNTSIDECLSSPCQHGGSCRDAVYNYTCDCSNIFYTGANCEIPKVDPTQSGRKAAFWSVLGVISGIIVLLTLSDLPWGDILTSIGCSFHRFNCCAKEHNDENINENDLHLSDSPTNDQNSVRKKQSTSKGMSTSKGPGYHVMNTVWNPEVMNNQTSRDPQYNGYCSPNQAPVQSYAAPIGSKQNQPDDRRVYAVDLDKSTNAVPKPRDPADTMVSWTQQLQEQLRNKPAREASASSTKQLIHSTNSNDD